MNEQFTGENDKSTTDTQGRLAERFVAQQVTLQLYIDKTLTSLRDSNPDAYDALPSQILQVAREMFMRHGDFLVESMLSQLADRYGIHILSALYLTSLTNKPDLVPMIMNYGLMDENSSLNEAISWMNDIALGYIALQNAGNIDNSIHSKFKEKVTDLLITVFGIDDAAETRHLLLQRLETIQERTHTTLKGTSEIFLLLIEQYNQVFPWKDAEVTNEHAPLPEIARINSQAEFVQREPRMMKIIRQNWQTIMPSLITSHGETLAQDAESLQSRYYCLEKNEILLAFIRFSQQYGHSYVSMLNVDPRFSKLSIANGFYPEVINHERKKGAIIGIARTGDPYSHLYINKYGGVGVGFIKYLGQECMIYVVPAEGTFTDENRSNLTTQNIHVSTSPSESNARIGTDMFVHFRESPGVYGYLAACAPIPESLQTVIAEVRKQFGIVS